MCAKVNVRCVWVAFVCCCFACSCVLELVVCRGFARVVEIWDDQKHRTGTVPVLPVLF